MNYKISVIIPVYNAEYTLENTINSIINQSFGFENIELILIDDNSTDNSKDMILRYANKYTNIKYFFSDKNHGFPGFGRNYGVKLASTKYLMFIDNDDEYDQYICEKLYFAAEKYNSDIVCCAIKEIDEVSEVIHKICDNRNDEIISVQGEEIFEYETSWVWNKLFRKEIVEKNNINFLTDTYCDDKAFCIEYMLHANKMICLNDYIGYLWMRRNESLSNSIELKNLISIFRGYDYMVDLLITNNKTHLFPVVSNSGTLFLLDQSSLLESKNDRKKFLVMLYDFEEKCEFTVNITNPFFYLLNFFVIHKKSLLFETSICCFKQEGGGRILYFISVRRVLFICTLNQNSYCRGIMPQNMESPLHS